MKKVMKINVVFVLCIMVLTGCGQAGMPEVVTETSLEISDQGEITSCLVGDFNKTYYNVSELTDMVMTDAAEYNTVNQTGETTLITVEKVELMPENGSKVLVIRKYNNSQTYMDYNESTMFYGTVEEALGEGYSLDVTLTANKDGSTMTAQELAAATERYIIITQDRANIYAPKAVTHISSGAAMNEDGSVNTRDAEDLVYILLK